MQAQEVPLRLSDCADSGGSICLWFSLFDLTGESAPSFQHLGLIERATGRRKPAFDAFARYALTHR